MAGVTSQPTTAHQPRRRSWSVAEYERFVSLGIFGPEERLELIEGEIVEKMPQRPQHATAIELVSETCRDRFGPGYRVRVQLPIRLTGSVPEPDIAVVVGGARDFANQHPTGAELIIEISDTTLDYDQTTKARIYGRTGIAEYWIVNLPERTLEVRRQPARNGYGSLQTFGETDSVSPLARPDLVFAVADLLP